MNDWKWKYELGLLTPSEWDEVENRLMDSQRDLIEFIQFRRELRSEAQFKQTPSTEAKRKLFLEVQQAFNPQRKSMVIPFRLINKKTSFAAAAALLVALGVWKWSEPRQNQEVAKKIKLEPVRDQNPWKSPQSPVVPVKLRVF
ncbi:MAG: hypothetical protein CL678_03590 [Bdellovibrionaceae bacterium]|nr:hypothetical protein [Pseudobdellovibrionaceae bacterium]|tara:strand:- start:4521 stop:4949 length:429 start_codon:yes stop_codon:yes gene_type:complete